jgi:raffinose/stachyose/melibiose transport system permease protein
MAVHKHKGWIMLFLLPTLILFAVFYLIPLAIVSVTSFSSWNGFDPMKMIGLRNYQDIFLHDPKFKESLLNTLKWATFAVLVHVPFGVLVALILSKKPFGWRFVRSVSLIPNIISSAAMAILYVFIFNPGMGLLNSFIRTLGFKDFDINWFYNPNTAFISVTLTWVFFAGIITLITMAELASIPASLHEAARMDGATDLQIDWFINIPLLRNIIGTGMILAVTAIFKAFEIIYLTTAGGPGNMTTNLALMVYSEVTTNYRYGYGNAVGIINLLLGVVIILVITKVFRMGRSSYE